MRTMCGCGMTLEAPAAPAGCPECGTGICRSCAIELERATYCRWCAGSLARIGNGG